MNLNSHRSPCCDSDEQRSTVNNTSNEYNQTDRDLMARVLSNHNIGAAVQHGNMLSAIKGLRVLII